MSALMLSKPRSPAGPFLTFLDLVFSWLDSTPGILKDFVMELLLDVCLGAFLA